MADAKISALPSATVPLAGTEVLPVVQGGTTDKVTAADLLRQNGQTVTTSNPVLSLAQTWNAGGVTFTGWKLNVTNTASAAGSLLLDLQADGVTRFAVGHASAAPYILTAAQSGIERFRVASQSSGASVEIYSGGTNSFLGFGTPGSTDTNLFRDAANTLALRNSTNAQTFRVYNTYTDASNYERGTFDWSSITGTLSIGTQRAGTGSTRGVSILIGNSAVWTWTTSGNLVCNFDNAADLGASGANRPRSGYFGTSVMAGTIPTGLPTTPNVAGFGNSWAFLGGDTVTDAAGKRIRIGVTHYTNAEEPFTLIDAIAGSTTSVLSIGGGTGTGNAATEVSVWTAANNTTTSGTQRWAWNSSGHFLAVADNTYDIGASGATRPRNIFVANSVTAGVGYITANNAYYAWTGRSVMRSGADGHIVLTNAAETDFTRLQFGGTTSSFPAIKRYGANLGVRLADDSAYAELAASGFEATGRILSQSAQAMTAGGGALAYGLTSTSAFGVYAGSGAPTISAAKGSLYLRSDGTTTNDRMYVNTNGSTTWTAVTTAA